MTCFRPDHCSCESLQVMGGRLVLIELGAEGATRVLCARSMRSACGGFARSRRGPASHMRSRAFLIIAGVLAFPQQASSAPIDQSPPLPRPRLADASSHPAPYDAAPVEQAKPEPTIDQACLDRLGAAGIEFEAVTLLLAAKPGCAIETPVRLKAVKLAPQWRTSVRLPDEPTLSCRFGERFGHWLRDLVAPLIAGELAIELKSVRTGPGYECRNRNRAEAGKISAHASGLAADVASFELANGGTLAIKPNGDEHLRATVDAIRVAACGWFTTVLGPGSDVAHADHMHVDILQHGSSDRYRICQRGTADQSRISGVANTRCGVPMQGSAIRPEVL